MVKYSNLQSNVFSIFASQAWVDLNTRAFPAGIKGDKGDPPYVRMDVVADESGANRESVSGLLMIEIYTQWGDGPAKSIEIADQLDALIQNKTINGTQFFSSSLSALLQDRDDENLGKRTYQVSFQHYEAKA